MKKKIGKILCVLLASLMLVGTLPAAAFAEEDDAVSLEYGEYDFNKISNPSAGSGEPDGINTDDSTGFGANRLNSYAWAVASRGDYIYIGTNRTLFGSALNAVSEVVHAQNENITMEMMGKVVDFVSGGDVPVNLDEEDYIPQIIKFDVNNGSTEVIYQPNTERGDDGVLYYTDMDGNLLPAADVASETASFRSVIELNGNLYFGSLGANMLQLVRVDGEDNAKVVFQTIGLVSSLRACCKYGEGENETIFFGGQDTTYIPWLQYRADPENAGDNVLPIVIRRLDPATAGTDHEDWSGMIADFRDFGQYARANVYSAGGGNVWDLCSYNGKVYLVLAFDRGWALFRGEEVGDSDPDANEFGWKWTEIVGDDSIYSYPLAMDEEVGELNEQYRQEFGCSEFAPNLVGAGLLESTATPYVYNGKMYIGSFDNATAIQSETVIKALTKLQYVMNFKQTGSFGPSLSQIFGPMYEVLTHPQHVWVMDENEEITPVDSANELLENTTVDYVWRFVEHDGKLYTGTFDSSTAYNYFLDFDIKNLTRLFQQSGVEPSDEFIAMKDGTFVDSLLAEWKKPSARGANPADASLKSAAVKACDGIEKFLNGEETVEALLSDMTELQNARGAVSLRGASPATPSRVISIIDELLASFDVEGLTYWAEARKLVRNAEHGFDLFVTEDGESWEALVRDGFEDPYNYGARTFTVCNGELYVGTANPYYGAQLWQVCDRGHDWEEPVYEWAEDYSSAYAYRVCLNDENHVQSEEGVVTSAITRYPTVFNEGEITYTATFENPDFETQEVRLSVSRLESITDGLPCGEDDCPGAKFTDMPSKSHWAHDPIDWAIVNNITAGTTPTTFSPTAACTRAQVMTFIWRAAGSPEPISRDNPFTDVADNAYYLKAVLWAVENGITAGTTPTSFSPNEKCTRAQAITFIWRAAGSPEAESDYPFTDVSPNAYYYTAVAWAIENDVTAGMSATMFCPNDTCMRARVLTFIYQAVMNG